MTLLVGTDEGVFRVDGLPFEPDDAELAVDGGRVTGLAAADGGSRVFAGATSGLYRSDDSGRTWDVCGPEVGDRSVTSVLAVDGTVYAGTNDPALYRSTDGGGRWTELTGFRELPSRDEWRSPVDPDRARLRTLASPPGRPDRLYAGIEAGGVHVSDDGGRTWTDRRGPITDDIHQLVSLGEDRLVAATGYLDLRADPPAGGPGGVHRSLDGAASWERLDPENDHAYVRALLVHEGMLYFSGARQGPRSWREEGIDARLFEAPDLGRRPEAVEYPGRARELLEAWTLADGRPVAGSCRYGPAGPDDGRRGRLVGRAEDGGYETLGRLPGNVKALLVV